MPVKSSNDPVFIFAFLDVFNKTTLTMWYSQGRGRWDQKMHLIQNVTIVNRQFQFHVESKKCQVIVDYSDFTNISTFLWWRHSKENVWKTLSSKDQNMTSTNSKLLKDKTEVLITSFIKRCFVRHIFAFLDVFNKTTL